MALHKFRIIIIVIIIINIVIIIAYISPCFRHELGSCKQDTVCINLNLSFKLFNNAVEDNLGYLGTSGQKLDSTLRSEDLHFLYVGGVSTMG